MGEFPSTSFFLSVWLCHSRDHRLLAFIQVAAVDIIDTELLDAFEEYSGYGDTSVKRVRFVLMKLDSDRRHGTDYFANKFIGKVEAIFSGLPKPKEWQSLLNNDLPLLTSIDEDVQEISVLAIRPRRPTTTHRNPKNWRKPGSRLPVVSSVQ